MHIAVIPDGNRRWAKKNLKNPLEGHKIGVKKLLELIDWFLERNDVKELSVFLLSTENFKKRSRLEITHLQNLGVSFLKDIVKEYYGLIELNIAGFIEEFDDKIKKAINDAKMKLNKGKKLNILINYGGRQEIANAVCLMIKEGINCNNIAEYDLKKYLWVSNDVDLIIRTGKEKRISNFLIYQAAYAELFFLDLYWPEVSKQVFEKIMEEFYARERRFGK